MNRISFLSLALAGLLCAALTVSEGRAEGNSTSMGALMTVVPDGASDAARNPALLGFQKKGRSVALGLRMGPYSKQTVDQEENSDFKYELDYSYTGSLTAGYSWRSGSAVYALAFNQVPDMDQLEMQKVVLSFQGSMDIPGFGTQYIISKSEEKTLKFNPSLVFAWALPVSGDGYLGVQILSGFSYVKTDATSEYVIPAALFSGGSEFSTTLLRLSLEAGLGYTQRFENGHTGIMVRTGSLSFDRQSGDSNVHNSGSGNSRDSGGTGNNFRNTSGIAIAAGVYQRPLPYLGFALEAGYRFPVSYRYTELDEEDSLVAESASQVTEADKFEFKGGIEFLISPELTFSGGLMLAFEGREEAKLDGENNGQEAQMENLDISALMFGATYRLDDNTLLSGAFGIILAHIEIRNQLESDFRRLDIILDAVYNY